MLIHCKVKLWGVRTKGFDAEMKEYRQTRTSQQGGVKKVIKLGREGGERGISNN